MHNEINKTLIIDAVKEIDNNSSHITKRTKLQKQRSHFLNNLMKLRPFVSTI